MKPLMNPQETASIEATLQELARKVPLVDCLEWGSGGSTVYFTEFLNSISADYRWQSLEHDRRWYDKMKAMTAANPKVELAYFKTGPGDPRSKTLTMDDYVDYPRSLGKKFDFILVDGRKRRRCLIEASVLVKDSGVVVLHDASRTYYHCAFSHFRGSDHILPDLWIGRA